MPLQIYLANVVFGANATNYFRVVANTYQEAATAAVLRYEANGSAELPNGNFRFVGQSLGHTNAVGNGTGRLATVFIKDPNLNTNRAFEVIVRSNNLDSANQIYGQFSIGSTKLVQNQY